MSTQPFTTFAAPAVALSPGLQNSAAKVVTLTGTLNVISQTAPFWDASVAVGTPYRLTLLFDGAAPNLYVADPARYGDATDSGAYLSLGNPYTITAVFGNYSFSQTDTRITIRTGLVGHYLLIFENENAFIQNGLSVIYVHGYVGRYDSTSQPVIPDNSLSNIQQRPLSVYPERGFGIAGTFDRWESAGVFGNVTDYTVTTIAVEAP